MSVLRILAGPLIGAIIGYITNYIAIKMLFRPLVPKYVLGVRVPFTPGIIPRRKAQLADALGKAVFAKFFNWDDLEIVFLSGTFADEVAERVSMELKGDRTFGELMEGLPDETARAVTDTLASRIRTRMVEGGMVREIALKAGSPSTGSGTGSGTGTVPSTGSGTGSGSGTDSCTGTGSGTDAEPTSIKAAFAASLASAYAGPIAEKIETYLDEEGDALIADLLRDEGEKLKEERTGEIISRLFPDEEAFKAGIKAVYLRFMAVHVRPIVESIDIVTQITGKMNDMSAGEVESLVLDIVARELRMVVWFGAFLGATIGVVNIFI